MTNQRKSAFLEIDWPDDLTSHKFMKGKPPPETDYITNDRMTWYVCTACGGYKLIKANPATVHGGEERLIWRTVPYNMTSVCPKSTSP